MSWSNHRRSRWDRHTRPNPYGRSSRRTQTTEDGRILNPTHDQIKVGQLISYVKETVTGLWHGPYMTRVVQEGYLLKTDTGEDLMNPRVFVGTIYPEGWKTS